MEKKQKKKSRSAVSYMIDAARLFFWPRGGWRRTIRYTTIQMARMPSTPYALAIGFASGAFISFTPFLGFHFLLAALLAWIFRGNIVASALGTIVGNPLTFPFIWITDYILGMLILSGELLSFKEAHLPQNFSDIENIFFPILVGSAPSGFTAGLLTFILVFFAVKIYRKQRAKLKQEQRKEKEDDKQN